MGSIGLARTLALVVPVALLAGALGSQYLGGLYPCEMCHWQRWPHYAAVPLALLSIVLRDKGMGTVFLWLAAVAIFASGAIGVFHAGVEYGWWEGLTSCSTSPGGGGDFLADIMATPVISCDQPQWTLFGISLAGFNAIISIGAAMVIAWLTRKTTR
ncbi:disulfide bond formation protein B [Parasphingopyxis lamellibrachiae]|uniref:Disulfide bond formation protein DsbB n=1 Tax=Parasphingopyxis lamellibrachiae TaxID=680125 RepID=A0A3D9FIR1_9SPHN|nr:disulfide bond formation protein B [Parasphingopyxis lamellibrachiae]RED17684.1 disulfide bond formation protein DsbB [Parasphingopyxis lamellibrachiae]